tara:strand:+ start:1426 stop:2217 length:792 start_codon:yes stop_codon:yes gene_type:complete
MKSVTYDNLTSLIANKRVAIIGPADYVNKELGDKHGEYIDSFDIVIRLNSMIKYPEEHKLDLTKYYGSKFNILASSFWYKNDDPKLIKKNYSRFTNYNNYKDIKNNIILFENINRNLFHNIYKQFKSSFDMHNNFSYCNMPNNVYNYIKKFLNNITRFVKTPTTGLLAIISILLMKPQELYVSGISMYIDTKYNGYYDYYNEMPKEEVEKLISKPDYRFDGKTYRKSFEFGHNINDEQIIMKYLISNNLIKVDNYLHKLYMEY